MSYERGGQASFKSIPHVIKFTDMSDDLRDEVIKKAQEGMDLFNTELQIAKYLRTYFEKQYTNSVWHCAVGRKFGAFVTYEAKHFIEFYIGQTAFLLFKSG